LGNRESGLGLVSIKTLTSGECSHCCSERVLLFYFTWRPGAKTEREVRCKTKRKGIQLLRFPSQTPRSQQKAVTPLDCAGAAAQEK